MTAEILINVSPREVRAALVEEGVLQEIFIERSNRRGLISNIYKGRVSRVLPGMQAAFIDIGLERTAFLHASDIVHPAVGENGQPDEPVEQGATQQIQQLVTEGGEILVQVLKDPLGTKGARLTTFITIPSRYLVYMPKGRGIGISARIEDEAERHRLREAASMFVQDNEAGGYIVRTAAEGASPEALRADMLFLQKLWTVLCEKAAMTRPGNLVHEDLPLAVRVLRDVVSSGVDKVSVDHEDTFQRMREFARTFMPDMTDRIELYDGDRPIFDLYGIEDEIRKSLDRKVPLKSGGYLMFDQTEAMTTIDVNTGAYVGHRTLEETIFRTNLEAAVAIARQLRLRNLGGIIIVDFIDMEEEEHRRQVLQALEKALVGDHAKNHISSVSPLGLVEMTRKRTRESLEHMLCSSCPTCEGRGFVKTTETVCYEIFREILRQSRQFQFQELMVLAHQDVIERLLDEESAALAELEVHTGKPIRLQTEALYQQDQYDVVLM
ncbi:ribonuclease G [Povalibacter uvarum]|uniref:Ribonuclease G n=1 Tax=Povalibacter uvarum TaxID=732238 RepID=A0A841HN59_9GAMM|nr:ribonuclease G [Povalibacter uvarum]MBB6094306.1 ribonuclease G [Povalibacter uvarum]